MRRPSRAHDEPLEGRKSHGRIDRVSPENRAGRRAIAEEAWDEPRALSRATGDLTIAVSDVPMRRPVESVTAHFVTAIQLVGKAVQVRDLGERVVERRVEHRDLRNAGSEDARRGANTGDVVRVVQRRELHELIERLENAFVDALRPREILTAVHDAMAHRLISASGRCPHRPCLKAMHRLLDPGGRFRSGLRRWPPRLARLGRGLPRRRSAPPRRRQPRIACFDGSASVPMSLDLELGGTDVEDEDVILGGCRCRQVVKVTVGRVRSPMTSTTSTSRHSASDCPQHANPTFVSEFPFALCSMLRCLPRGVEGYVHRHRRSRSAIAHPTRARTTVEMLECFRNASGSSQPSVATPAPRRSPGDSAHGLPPQRRPSLPASSERRGLLPLTVTCPSFTARREALVGYADVKVVPRSLWPHPLPHLDPSGCSGPAKSVPSTDAAQAIPESGARLARVAAEMIRYRRQGEGPCAPCRATRVRPLASDSRCHARSSLARSSRDRREDSSATARVDGGPIHGLRFSSRQRARRWRGARVGNLMQRLAAIRARVNGVLDVCPRFARRCRLLAVGSAVSVYAFVRLESMQRGATTLRASGCLARRPVKE